MKWQYLLFNLYLSLLQRLKHMKLLYTLIITLFIYSGIAVSKEIDNLPDAAKEYLPKKPASFSRYIPYAISDPPGNFLFLSPELAEEAVLSESSTDEDVFEVTFTIKKYDFKVRYDAGASDDPAFYITSDYLESPVLLGGETLFISKGGKFYLSSRSNEYFDVKRKYQLSNSNIEEIPQPYYMVNQRCKTSELLTLYEKPCDHGKVIAKVAEGNTVNAILHKPNQHCGKGPAFGVYLVSTSFGLSGWAISRDGYPRSGKPLSCLQYSGD